MDELLKVVNEYGQTVGNAFRSICHNGKSHIPHAVVHMHVINNHGILLQKRATSKKIQPGKWDTAVGGHVGATESTQTALLRESFEEIGIDAAEATHLTGYMFSSEIETEWVDIFILKVTDTFTITVHNDEVDQVAFFTPNEITELIQSGEATPNFTMEFEKYIRNVLA